MHFNIFFLLSRESYSQVINDQKKQGKNEELHKTIWDYNFC